jgi:hypothetical protein
MYSKKSRVESMSYLSRYNNVQHILIEDVDRWDIILPPAYYLGEPIKIIYELCERNPIDSLRMQMERYGEVQHPKFILFFDEKDLQSRVENVKTLLPNIVYEITLKPGFIDKMIHRINPINANETITIYRNKDFYPKKVDK